MSTPKSQYQQFTRPRQAKFLEALERGDTVTIAAKAIAITRKTIYRCRERDPEFRAAWDDAIEAGTQALEQEAKRRAVEGVSEPVYFRGEEVGAIQRYSDTLLIFLLKARRPETYRERYEVKHEHDVSRMSESELLQIAGLAPVAADGVGGIGPAPAEPVH